MNAPQSARRRRILEVAAALEAVPYFLLGTFLAGTALVATVATAMEAWRSGERTSVYLLVSCAAATLVGFLFGVRRRRIIFAVAFLLALIGLAAYCVFTWRVEFSALVPAWVWSSGMA